MFLICVALAGAVLCGIANSLFFHWRGSIFSWQLHLLWLGISACLAIGLRKNREWLRFFDTWNAIFMDAGERPFARAARWSILFATLAVALALLGLELRDPFYFSQDDNLVQFLPIMEWAGDQLFQGVFPAWNPYQFLGQPIASTGTYSLLYPMTYLAYAVARWVLKEPLYLLEVFCGLHLVVGAGIMAAYLCWKGCSIRWAVLGAVSFVLSGMFLQGARSWYYVAPLAVWIPAIAWSMELFLLRPRPAYAVHVGLLLGLYYYAGNAQFWIYLAFGCGLMGWVLLGSMPFRRAVNRMSVLFLTALLIAMPLLFFQYRLVRDVPRGVWGEGIQNGLWATLFPYPFLTAAHPNHWGNLWVEHMTNLYFIGWIWVVGLVIFWLGLARRQFQTSLLKSRAQLAQVLVLQLAFLLALGSGYWLWGVVGHLPVFNKFTNAFKFLPFVAFGCVALSAPLWSAWMEYYKVHLRQMVLVERILLGLGILCLVCSVFYSRSAFFVFADQPTVVRKMERDLPWIAMLREQKQLVATNLPFRSAEAGYLTGWVHSMPTVLRVPSLWGYDPLVSEGPISRVLLAPNAPREFGMQSLATTHTGGQVVYAERDAALPVVPLVEPVRGDLRVDWNGAGIELVAKELLPRSVRFRLLWREGWSAIGWNAAGQKQDLSAAVLLADQQGRLVIDGLKDVVRLHVLYEGFWQWLGWMVLVGWVFLAWLGILGYKKFYV